LELLVFCVFRWQIRHFQRIGLLLKFLVDVLFSFVHLIFLSDILINLILFYHFLVHFRYKPIPSILLALAIIIEILWNYIVWGYLVTCKFGTYLSRPLSALLFYVSHCSTVLTSPLTERGGLVTFFTTIESLWDLRLGLERWGLDGLTLPLCVLGIPRYLLNVFGCVLHGCYFEVLESNYLCQGLNISFKLDYTKSLNFSSNKVRTKSNLFVNNNKNESLIIDKPDYIKRVSLLMESNIKQILAI